MSKQPPTWRHEDEALAAGYGLVAGVDEAGRGPLAGNVVAAAVLLPRDLPAGLLELADSKQMTEAARERCFELLHGTAIAIGVGRATPREIDEINILQATFLAMRRALEGVPQAGLALVDGNQKIRGLALPQRTLVKGDALSLSIAAASVIAKVTRDRELVALDAEYPAYGFARHKGYGTAAHRAALLAHGPTPHHRASFLKRLFL